MSRVSIDRDALRVLCLAAGNLCRLHTDKRVAAVRAALDRVDADWKQHCQQIEARPRCPTCKGTGNSRREWWAHYAVALPCLACDGTGYEKQE